jgi:hypothetical protein
MVSAYPSFGILTGDIMTVSSVSTSIITGTLQTICSLQTTNLTTNDLVSGIIQTSSISLHTYHMDQAVYGQTDKKSSILPFTNIIIQSSNMKAELDHAPAITQVYTFGSTIANQWVAVGGAANTIAYSNNGLQWFPAANTLFTQGNDVVWTGTKWVACGINTIGYSNNGINWTASNSVTGVFNGISWNGSMLVSVGNDNHSSTILYSNDGIDWSGVTGQNNIFYGGLLGGQNVSHNGLMWIAVGGGSFSTYNIGYSYDGITWTGLTITYLSAINDIAWNGSIWIAVGVPVNNVSIIYSEDGINWNPVEGTASILPTANGISWNGTMWVAVGTGNTPIVYSYNGISWNTTSNLIFNISGGNKISWNGNMWIASGQGSNTLAYSYNGLTWSGLGSTIFNQAGYGIAYNGRRPYTITFPSSIAIGIIDAPFPLTFSALNQIDIASDSYYNSGYTNFSLSVQTESQ